MTWRAYAHAPSEPPPFALMLVAPTSGQAAPEGQMTWAVHFSLAPTLFEPAETAGAVSPFMPRAARAGHARRARVELVGEEQAKGLVNGVGRSVSPAVRRTSSPISPERP